MKKSILFFLTSFVLLTIHQIAQSQTPTITSPANNATGVSPCGFNVVVSAINPPPSDGRFYRVRVQYKRSDQGTPTYSSNSVYEPIDGSDTDFGPYTVFIPASGSLQNNTIYNIRSAYQVFDEDTEAWVLYGTNSPVINVTTSSLSSNPVVTAPANNATGVSITPTINVAAYAGCGTLSTVTIEVDKAPADWIAPDRQIETFIDNSGPFTWSPTTSLDYNTQYQIRVRFNSSAGPVYTTVTNFTTQPLTLTDPLLVSPADDTIVDLCSDVTLTVNANSTAARSLRVKIFPNGFPGSPIFDQTYNFANATEATTQFSVTVPRALFANNINYQIELTSRTGTNLTGTLIGQSYNDLFTGSDKSSPTANTPVITSPADGSTVNSFTPVITIQSPFGGCTLNSVLYEILQGASGTTVVDSQSYSTPTYSWTVPTFLTAGATYRARVTYTTADGVFSDTNLFTISANPGIQIISPSPLTNLNPCGFTTTVARYPSASTIQIEYRLKPSGSFGAPFYSTDIGTAYTFAFDNTQLRANATYEMRLTAGTGTGGSFVANSGSVTLVDFSTRGVSGILTPTLTSPTDGETGVSLTPTLTFGAYQGSCGAVGNYQIEVVPVGGTGDWNTRPGYFSSSSASSSITIPTGNLQANTTYKVRISVRVDLNGGIVGFYNNYDGNDSSPAIYTFTTIGSVLPPTIVNNVVDDQYLNEYTNIFTANSVAGATEYEWQFSETADFSGTIITKTSTTTNLTFQAEDPGFTSGTRYFVRVRGRNPSTGAAGAFSIAPADVVSFYHPLFPAVIVRPTPNEVINGTALVLRAWYVQNSTGTYFQVATDPGFTNLVNSPNPIPPTTPTALDPAGTGQIGYLNTGFRRLFTSSGVLLTPGVNITDPTVDFAPQTVVSLYSYLRYLIPGQTYYVRAKSVRNVAGTFVQPGYWGATATFSVPAYVRTHTIFPTGTGAPGPGPNTDIFFGTDPDGIKLPNEIWGLISYDFQLSTSSDFSTLLVDRNITGQNFYAASEAPLEYSTTYYARVRSYATNDPAGSSNSTPWFSYSFTTIPPPAGRTSAAAAAMGEILVGSMIAPNPYEDEFVLKVSPNYKKVVITVLNQMGQVIHTKEATGGNNLSLGNKFPSGLYVVQIADEKGSTEVLKVVKR